MRNFVAAMGQLYPCKLCRKHLQQQLRDPELGPADVSSRGALVSWVCRLHNIVNRDIGKKPHDCGNLGLDLKYLKNCGECKVQKGNGAAKASGFHPDTGPWDAGMYASHPTVLSKVTTQTQLFQARRHEDVLETLLRLQTISPSQLLSLRAKLKGPKGKKTLKALQAVVHKAKDAAKASLTEQGVAL